MYLATLIYKRTVVFFLFFFPPERSIVSFFLSFFFWVSRKECSLFLDCILEDPKAVYDYAELADFLEYSTWNSRWLKGRERY